MRIADIGGRPKVSIEPVKSDHIRQIQRKILFNRPTFPSQALRMSDHHVYKLRLAWSLPITPPRTCGDNRSLMSLARARACVNSVLKNFEPNLANETTWEIGPLTPSPFGGRNSQVWLYNYKKKCNLCLQESFPSYKHCRLEYVLKHSVLFSNASTKTRHYFQSSPSP